MSNPIAPFTRQIEKILKQSDGPAEVAEQLQRAYQIVPVDQQFAFVSALIVQYTALLALHPEAMDRFAMARYAKTAEATVRQFLVGSKMDAA